MSSCWTFARRARLHPAPRAASWVRAPGPDPAPLPPALPVSAPAPRTPAPSPRDWVLERWLAQLEADARAEAEAEAKAIARVPTLPTIPEADEEGAART